MLRYLRFRSYGCHSVFGLDLSALVSILGALASLGFLRIFFANFANKKTTSDLEVFDKMIWGERCAQRTTDAITGAELVARQRKVKPKGRRIEKLASLPSAGEVGPKRHDRFGQSHFGFSIVLAKMG